MEGNLIPGFAPMVAVKVRVAKLQLPSRGFWSKLSCKKSSGLASFTVHLRAMGPLSGEEPAVRNGRRTKSGPTLEHDTRLNAGVRTDLRFRLGPSGLSLPGSPVHEVQPEQVAGDVLLEVTDGVTVLAK